MKKNAWYSIIFVVFFCTMCGNPWIRDITDTLYSDENGNPSITINGGNFALPEGGGAKGTKTLIATAANAGTSGVRWSSSDPSVAAVNPSTGEVTSGGLGTAIISAALTGFPSIQDSVSIAVQRKSWLTDIETASLANGEIINIDAAAGKFTLKAKGQAAIDSNIFGFVYLPVNGDFTMKVKLDSVSYGIVSGVSSIAGLIVIPQSSSLGNINQDSAGKLSNYPTGQSLLYASVLLRNEWRDSRATRVWYARERTTQSSYSSETEIIGGNEATDAELNSPGRWIMLSRQGDLFTMANSANGGTTWVPVSRTVVIGPAYAGIWVTGGSSATLNDGYTIASFSEWSMVDGDGNATQAQLNAPEARISLAYLE